jgi:hypothetical protein
MGRVGARIDPARLLADSDAASLKLPTWALGPAARAEAAHPDSAAATTAAAAMRSRSTGINLGGIMMGSWRGTGETVVLPHLHDRPPLIFIPGSFDKFRE